MSQDDHTEHGLGLPVREPDTTSAAPPAAADPPKQRRRSRVVALAAVTIALLVVAAGAGAAVWRNYAAGAAWQERAAAEADRAEVAETALGVASERAEALERQVADLEAEVGELEERVVALAGEKAGAEDAALVAEETAERLAALSRFAAETGASLRQCISLNLQLTDDIVAAVNTATLDAEATNRRIGEVNQVCGEAQEKYEDLRRRVDALGS